MTRIALVTGGMGGIGEAICKALAQNNYQVITTYASNQEKCKQFIEKTKQDGFDFKAYQCNVADFNSCKLAVEQIIQDIGTIEILVNNAGITQDGQFKNMTLNKWEQVVNTNLGSMFNVTRQVITGMLNSGFGRIVNISSINGQKGQFGQTNYAASKAGIHGFTMSLAQEVAKKGITVNTIAPGYIATDMVMAVPEDIRNKIIANIPVGRLGTPEEIADLVIYLVSDHAGFITGSEIAINGGQHMM